MPTGRASRKNRRGHPILTHKEQRFLKAFVKTGNQRLSALSAGYSPVNPDQSANCVMKQLRRKVPELLEHIGLHLEKVFSKTLVPGLKAKETEFFAQNGIVMEMREVVDHEQRGKYFDRYCKLVGLYGNGADENSDFSGRSPVTVNLVISDQRVADAVAYRLAGGEGGDEHLHWMYHWTNTRDDQDPEKPYKRFPQRDYFWILHKRFLREPILFIEKSRSMITSWWAAAEALHYVMTPTFEGHPVGPG